MPLTVSVRLDRIEGRKLHLSAEITADGAVTADAEAVFLTLTEDNLEAVFGRAGRLLDGRTVRTIQARMPVPAGVIAAADVRF